MGGRGASSGGASGSSKLYNDFVNNKNTIAELERNIRAQKYDNPNARVGDTRLDSDRMISLYTDKLSPAEYSKFNVQTAEDKLFRKLHQLERKAGFKK